MNLELNLKSFPSVANLTRHKYIFSRVKSTSCALIRSDWFSGSMRRQLSLDPLSARAERCVTERGARTGLDFMVTSDWILNQLRIRIALLLISNFNGSYNGTAVPCTPPPPPPPRTGKNAFRPAAILRADGRADPLWISAAGFCGQNKHGGRAWPICTAFVFTC